MFEHEVMELALEVVGVPALTTFLWLLWRRDRSRGALPPAFVGKLKRFARRPLLPEVGVGLVALASCAIFAWIRGVGLPLVSDEFSYLLAADTFAHGRLSNPAHPFWQHFEALNVLQQPTYQSKYPPGQGLLLAVGLLLGHPILGVWLGMALAAGTVTWMLRAWISPGWAVVGGLLLTARLGLGFYWSQTYWGGGLTVAGAALALGAVRRCFDPRTGPTLGSSATLGAGLGLLAITRPFEGLVASVPWLILTIAWILGKSPGAESPPKGRAVATLVLGTCLTLLPSLAFLAVYHRAVTGDVLEVPHRLYADRYCIAQELIPMAPSELGEDVPPEMARLAHSWYDRMYRPDSVWVGPRAALSVIASVVMRFQGFGLLLCTLLASRWLLRDPWLRLVFLVLAVAISAHLFVIVFFVHYAAPSAPLLLLLAVAGLGVLWNRGGRATRCLVLAAMAVQVVFAAWSLARPAYVDTWAVERQEIRQQLEADSRRHLVFVHYGQFHLGAEEWVYNGADIDGREVIFARDLGDEMNFRLLSADSDRVPWRLLVDTRYRGPYGADAPDVPVAELVPYALSDRDDGEVRPVTIRAAPRAAGDSPGR